MAELLDVFGARNLQAEVFSEKENKIFDVAWEYMVRTKNRMVDPKVFDDRTRETTRLLAQVFKREKGGATFEGMNPRTGIGMRLLEPRDLFGATAEVWDITWGTAGFRSWSAAGAPDATTFDASVAVQAIDAAQDFWDIALFGICNFAPSPRTDEFIVEINSEILPIQNIQYGLRNSEQATGYWDAAYFIQRASRFRLGFNVQNLGLDAAFPIGVVFESQVRNKTQVKNRPT